MPLVDHIIILPVKTLISSIPSSNPLVSLSIQVLRRDNRQGYKAGALVEGLSQVESQGYE